MKHIGNEIKRILDERRIVKKQFASDIGMTEMNLYKILRKESIDSGLLYRIACTLAVPVDVFFDEIPSGTTGIGHKVTGSRNNVAGNSSIHGDAVELEKARVQIAFLQKEIEDKVRLIEEKERLIRILMEKR